MELDAKKDALAQARAEYDAAKDRLKAKEASKEYIVEKETG